MLMIGIIAMFFARTWQNFTSAGVARLKQRPLTRRELSNA
jgi:hypothetical protein